jgi:hypothetical protein
MMQDEILGKVAERVKNFAVIYTVDLDIVKGMIHSSPHYTYSGPC